MRLRSLSLRGFVFSKDDFGNFLVAHSGTLRILRVIDCYLQGHYADFLDSASEDWGPQLSLTGVEVYGLRFERPDGGERTLKCARTEDWLERGAWKEVKKHMEFKLSEWPFERPEVEEALLCGRGNAVARKERALHDDAEREGWHKLPVRLG